MSDRYPPLPEPGEPGIIWPPLHTAAYETPPQQADRCGACGQFLRRDSLYANRCGDCWSPEDEWT